MNTTAPRTKRQSRYGLRYLLLELLENIYEIQRLLWLRLIAMPARFDAALFADEVADSLQKPEKAEDIEPIDPRSWLNRVLNEGAEVMRQRPGRNRNVYSEPFEVPQHCKESEEGVPYPRWVDWALIGGTIPLTAFLFYIAPILFGCIAVGCAVVLVLLTLRK
ncbi:hypothetical protein [Spirosoma sp. KUDC1026]|uniref:hypothetical protein n=1 Tax=Spirosoma sp. KUDC1026 TaxID=2745947 RepID=UPI00159BEEA1|nr:hypothetical protein [Spirosoma sp. KUDC1026]QKZ15162.1 hypothetical protein HU175_22075 [Spirosoma sp. KUDC1026]